VLIEAEQEGQARRAAVSATKRNNNVRKWIKDENLLLCRRFCPFSRLRYLEDIPQ
jgi:hypothetical protein